MREHEVPTHVQAEDKVLLWFTFPQIVAVVAVCALAYGAYRYAPVGPSEARLGLAVLLGLAGIAAVVGKVGGRGLPLVAADLLKFNLGARRYAGSPTQLARSEAPAPEQSKPDPPRLLAKKAVGGLGKAARRVRRKGRPPFRPHSWFGKRRQPKDGQGGGGHQPQQAKPKKPPHQVRGRHWRTFLAVTALGVLAVMAPPATALADDPDDEDPGWRLEEIYFEPPDPVPGRRIYVERLAVSGDVANVTLRAAHDLELRVRVYGGRKGKTLRMGANATMREGESKSYNLTLNGPSPSFTFSWVDALGFSGAVSLKSRQLPYPLPKADGGLCDLAVTSLEWTPGSISGVIASECIAETRQEVALPVFAGHYSQTVPALLDASVTRITGTVIVKSGTHRTTAPFVQGGETRFTLPVPNEKAVHAIDITADLAATLNVPLPPVLQTTHHPAWTQRITRRVSLSCGQGSSVSRTVRVYVYHPEHVRAVEVNRAPVTRTRTETIPLALSVGTDDPYQALYVPPPKPMPEPAEQTPVGDSTWWNWPWWGA